MEDAWEHMSDIKKEENKRLQEENKQLQYGNKRLEVKNKQLEAENKKLQKEKEDLQENTNPCQEKKLQEENTRLRADLEGVLCSLLRVVELNKSVDSEIFQKVQYLSEQHGLNLQDGAYKFPIVCTDKKQEDAPTHNGNQQTLQEASVIHIESKTEYQPTVPMKLDRATQFDREVQSTHSSPKKCASETGRPKLPAIPQPNTSHKPPSLNDAFRPKSNESFPPLSPNGSPTKAKGTKTGSNSPEKTTREIYSQRLFAISTHGGYYHK